MIYTSHLVKQTPSKRWGTSGDHFGDINSRNLLLNSRYTTPPKIAYMKNRIQKSISVLSYPKEFNGTKLSFLQDNDSTEEYNNYERIPSWFWLGPTFEKPFS